MGVCTSGHVNLGAELIKAVNKDNKAEVEQRLREGAPVNYETITDDGPFTALYCSVAWRRWDFWGTGTTNLGRRELSGRRDLGIFEALIRAGAHVNVKCGRMRSTPLMQAAADGDVNVMRVLLERGALVNLGDKLQDTALHYAASYRQSSSVILLLKAHANPNARNWEHRTPLHVASARGDMEVIMLLKAGGASSHVRDKNGAKPADLALMTGNGAAIMLLLGEE